jgi:AraC-like DNA-binding protein
MTERLVSTAESGVLDSLLREIRVASTVYCRSRLTAPWGFRVRAGGLAAFHVVTEGECWLDVEGKGEMRVRAGDLVILPRGDVHRLRDDPASATPWLEDLLAADPVDDAMRLRSGGGGTPTDLLCGAFSVEGSRQHPVLSLLPPLIHLRGDDNDALPWLASTLELIALEVNAPGAGAAAVCERLAEVMLTQSLRVALLDLEDAEGASLRLLRDRGIGPAVRAIHDQPQYAWTLGELAALTAMSRSALSARFRALTGDPPIRYATRCRLARAARQLRMGNATIAQLAAEAGYESESSFSRAFKRAFGLAPGSFRVRDEIHAVVAPHE